MKKLFSSFVILAAIIIIIPTVRAQTQAPVQPTVNLTASPASNSINQLLPGTDVTLSWSSTNATSTCTASGDWSGAFGLAGSFNVRPTYSSTYSMACRNLNGSAIATVEVFVGNPQGNGTTPNDVGAGSAQTTSSGAQTTNDGSPIPSGSGNTSGNGSGQTDSDSDTDSDSNTQSIGSGIPVSQGGTVTSTDVPANTTNSSVSTTNSTNPANSTSYSNGECTDEDRSGCSATIPIPPDNTNQQVNLDYSGLVKCDGVVGNSSYDSNGNPTGTPTPGEQNRQTVCNFAALFGTVNSIITYLFYIAIPLAVILFAYGGFLYLTGQKGNIDTAKKVFRAAAIGFIIMLVSWAGITTVINWFVNSDSGASSLIQSP